VILDTRITDLIPHREPFLWVDRIISIEPGIIMAEKDITSDLDVFRGHYPHHPILPGVLLCEAIFQTSALLCAQMIVDDRDKNSVILPVITRIREARFKRMVVPGDTIQMEVKLQEEISTAKFFKGTVRVKGKTVLRIEFASTLVEQRQGTLNK
jgi:3-hydroxyacyl-[acyl-carrier-protein] dehydratase